MHTHTHTHTNSYSFPFHAVLPPPVVNITAPPTPAGGDSYTLDCSARTEDYVITVPSVEWVNVGMDLTQPPQINGTVSANRSLTFNPIRTSHGTNYICQASIDIPLANITDIANTAVQNVGVLSKLFVFASVVVHVLLYYFMGDSTYLS